MVMAVLLTLLGNAFAQSETELTSIGAREFVHLDWWDGGVCLLAEQYQTSRSEVEIWERNPALFQEAVAKNTKLRLTRLDHLTSGTEWLVSIDSQSRTLSADGAMVIYYSVTVKSIYDAAVNYTFSDERLRITVSPDTMPKHTPQLGYQFHGDTEGICVSYNGLLERYGDIWAWLQQGMLSDHLAARLEYSIRVLSEQGTQAKVAIQCLDADGLNDVSPGEAYKVVAQFQIAHHGSTQGLLSVEVPVVVLADARAEQQEEELRVPTAPSPSVEAGVVLDPQGVESAQTTPVKLDPQPSESPPGQPASNWASGSPSVGEADIEPPTETPPDIPVPTRAPGSPVDTASPSGGNRWTTIWSFVVENRYVAEFGASGILWVITGVGLVSDIRLLCDYKKRKEENRWIY